MKPMDPESEGHQPNSKGLKDDSKGYSDDSIAKITKKLKEILSRNGIDYTPLSEGDLKIVYDLFLGKMPNLDNAGVYSGDVLHYIGEYFSCYKMDDSVAEKYYLMAIQAGNVNAMNTYAYILDYIENNPKEAEKYYLMAIQAGKGDAMNNYACMLGKKGNIPEAKKYYLMGIEKGIVESIVGYAGIMEDEKNTLEAKKYYLMAMEKGDHVSFERVHKIYIKEYCNDGGNPSSIDEYFYEFLRIAYINPNFKDKLCTIFKHLALIYLVGLEYIDAHIQYSPDSAGYKQAKKDFTDRITNLKDPTKVPTEVQQKDQPKDNK